MGTLGREHPWNTRRITHRHLHDERNLRDLHLLTRAWSSGPNAEVLPLDKDDPFVHEPSLEDDTSPEDVLLRLEDRVRAQQVQTLAAHMGESDRLADLSFAAGQESASRRWMTPESEGGGSIAPADKRALLLALYHSPLAWRLGPDAFLVRRRLITEVSVELLRCPHRIPASGAGTVLTEAQQDELCHQQFHWLKGYFNFLNPALVLAYHRANTPGGPRCIVSW